jgi:hypothetical protein
MFEELEQVVKTSGQQDKCCILSQHLCFHRQACGARVCLGTLFQRFVLCILPFPAVSGLGAPCESLSQHDPNTVCRLKFLSSCNRTKGMKYNHCAPATLRPQSSPRMQLERTLRTSIQSSNQIYSARTAIPQSHCMRHSDTGRSET